MLTLATSASTKIHHQTRWRHGEDCRNDTARRQEEEKLAGHNVGMCSLSELQAGIERWECYVSLYEKKLKHTLDDEIKLAVLEAVGPTRVVRGHSDAM